jgi:hypothetical protein
MVAMIIFLPAANASASSVLPRTGRDHPVYVCILFDGVPNLAVEYHPVGDDDDGVENGFVGVEAGQFDQLMGQPRDGVAFARTSRMLDEITLPRPVAFARQSAACARHQVDESGGKTSWGDFFLPVALLSLSWMMRAYFLDNAR